MWFICLGRFTTRPCFRPHDQEIDIFYVILERCAKEDSEALAL